MIESLACRSGFGWETGLSKMKAQAHYRLGAGACHNPPVYRNLLCLLWGERDNFPKRALPCPLTVLVQGVFAKFMVISPPHARGLRLLTISVTGDQSTLSFINDVLKFKMFSLKSIQAAGQCSPLIFNLLALLPALLLPSSLLILNSSGRPKEHATIKQEDQKQENTNNLTPKTIYPLNISNYRQPGQIHEPRAGDRNVFNYIWSLDCQVANCSVKLSKYGSSLLIIYISEAANTESRYTLV